MTNTVASPAQTRRWLPYAVLVGAVLALSTVAILIRMAQAEHIPSLVIATLRVGIAALVLTPYVLRRHQSELRRLSRADLIQIGAAGAALISGLFLSFVALEHTTVLIANLLTNTNPLWVALLEVLALKAVLGRRVWLGLGLALAGTLLFGLAGVLDTSRLGDNPLLGGAIALVAAFIAACYFILGRLVRRRVSTAVFMWLILLTGFAISLTVSLLSGTALLGYSAPGYFWILGSALVGQLMGHFLLAYCLAFLPATLVSISLQGVVVGSAVLAFFTFGEQPGPLQILASLVILAGVVMVIATQPRPSTPDS